MFTSKIFPSSTFQAKQKVGMMNAIQLERFHLMVDKVPLLHYPWFVFSILTFILYYSDKHKNCFAGSGKTLSGSATNRGDLDASEISRNEQDGLCLFYLFQICYSEPHYYC